MAHEHSVIDSDKHFSIDPSTREITNESGKIVIINHDHNSERFSFSIPKDVEGHDMSICNVVRIHYINIENETKTEYEGAYDADDLNVSPVGDKVTFSWLISRNATQYVGTLNFAIRFACVSDDGTEEYAWSTAIHKGIIISNGILNDESIVAANVDILEQWYKKLQLAAVGENIGDIDMLGYSIKNLASPVDASDAVNKKYVDDFKNSIEPVVANKLNKPVLLWERQPPYGLGFDEQTLETTEDPTQFDYLFVLYNADCQNAIKSTGLYPVSLINEGKPLFMETIEVTEDIVVRYYRFLDSVTSSGVHFSACTSEQHIPDDVLYGGLGMKAVIPHQVYGVNCTSSTEDEPDNGDGDENTDPESGGNVDLSLYATEQWVRNGYQPKGNYIKTVNGMTPDENGNIEITISGGNVARIGEIELLAANWTGSGHLYSQVVSVPGVTENSQVDLTPSVEQLVVFYEKDLTFVTENDNTVITVYAIGQKPENDYTIQVTIMEVNV